MVLRVLEVDVGERRATIIRSASSDFSYPTLFTGAADLRAGKQRALPFGLRVFTVGVQMPSIECIWSSLQCADSTKNEDCFALKLLEL